HLVEFAEKLSAAKSSAAAVEMSMLPALPAAGTLPPGVMITSAGYVIFYTVTPEKGRMRHRLSLSRGGASLTRSAGSFLVAYMRHLLELGPIEHSVGISEEARYHLDFELDTRAHEAFMKQRVRVPERSEAPAVARRCLAERSALRFDTPSLPGA
ncbi:MAG TPA: hypothetical protein VFS00_01750, partial [Polyangiaceae bacterium]|nr:hypothetical protein [Polyangiaceae bacterium]